MVPESPISGAEWIKLADVAEGARDQGVQKRYTDLAAMLEEERRNQMRAMVQALYTLPDDKVHAFTKSRLRAWARMEDDAVKRVAASYKVVMDERPSQEAWRRVTMVQSALKDLTPDERTRLQSLLPQLVPAATTTFKPLTPTPPEEPASAKKKGWWPFRK